MNTSFVADISSPRALLGVLLAAAVSLGSGACTLSAEADVPDVEVTQHDIAFAGIPQASLLGPVSTGMSFTQERPKLDLPSALDSTVQAVKIELRAKSGIKNFDFLRALRITMAPKGYEADPIELIYYDKADGAVVGNTLTIASRNPVNILDQWKAESAIFSLQVAGMLPEEDWSIDMVMHFSGKISYKY